MKVIQVDEFVKDFGDIGSVLRMETNADMPPLEKGKMRIRVMACSLSPADIHMLEGNFFLIQPSKFPFVPGMDVCGVVQDPNGSTVFQKGDIVVADNGMSPQGGLAEYMVVPQSEAVLKPSSVSVIEAAGSSSAITARNAIFDYCAGSTSRILILGGSGGVGSAAIQMAKRHNKASFIATTSTQAEMCKSLGADRVIDYRQENWWEIKEFQNEQQKFDVIIDTVGGGNYVDKAEHVLKGRKEGGHFIAVTGDNPKPDAQTLWKTIQFLTGFLLARPLYNFIMARHLPKYTVLMPYDEAKGRQDVLTFLEDKKLKIALDDDPLPFTKEGVCKAFQKVASGHAHGKVVVSISSENDDSKYVTH